jgi:putative oxidoreductase
VGLLNRLPVLGFMVIVAGAVVKVHFPHRLFIDLYGGKKEHGFEFHLLAMVLALIVFVKGAGVLSLDRSLYIHQIKTEITASQLLGEMK